MTTKKVTGKNFGTWDETKKQAEIILRQAIGTPNIAVSDAAIVYLTEGQFLKEEIGMLVFVSETDWVYRPKSEYNK